MMTKKRIIDNSEAMFCDKSSAEEYLEKANKNYPEHNEGMIITEIELEEAEFWAVHVNDDPERTE